MFSFSINQIYELHSKCFNASIDNVVINLGRSYCACENPNQNFQMSLKAEMEVAMKLLEKDIHDKQDTIISLRRQLDDIKLINLEMYKKLQVRHS